MGIRKSQVDKLVARWQELDEQQSRGERPVAWSLIHSTMRNSSKEEQHEAMLIANDRPWRK